MNTLRPAYRRLLAWAGVALVCSLAVVAAAPTENTKLLPFTAVLTGGQETLPNTSTAFGMGFFTLDPKTNVLNYSISFTALGSTMTVAHFHGPATPFQDAPPIVTLADAPTNPINGSTDPLTKEQVSALKKGLIYVNIHSTGLPLGEIRGQLLPGKPTFKFEAAAPEGLTTSPAAEEPPTRSGKRTTR